MRKRGEERSTKAKNERERATRRNHDGNEREEWVGNYQDVGCKRNHAQQLPCESVSRCFGQEGRMRG
jgi:hypothetical protein